MKGARRWALLILCAALLSGCGAPPPREEEKPRPVEEKPLMVDPLKNS